MKTQRSIQLFIYCSGDESSMKCVRPALNMGASEEEKGGLIRFLVAEGAANRH